METDGSLPYSQEPANVPKAEPDKLQSTPSYLTAFRSSLILSSHLA